MTTPAELQAIRERDARTLSSNDAIMYGTNDRRTLLALYDAQSDEVRRLRKMLAFAYSGEHLYGDDGELQDAQMPFPIDYVRDTLEHIEMAIHNRGMKALVDSGVWFVNGKCIKHNRLTCGLCLANSIAAAKCRLLGPAVEVSKRMRKTLEQKP